MKHSAILLGFVGFALFHSGAAAHVGLNEWDEPHQRFESARLMQWNESDILAEQLPAPPPSTPPVTPPPATGVTPAPVAPPVTDTTPPLPGDTPDVTDPASPPAVDGAAEEDFSLGDIPIVETIELTSEKARKALDSYVLVREKYKDAQLENYENLQDFVDQSPQGKAFEADVKAAGFPSVIEWNTTITTLSFAYDNSIDDQTADIKKQIAELQADTETAQEMRERMIKALTAMIPSDNNKKVLDELKADPAYIEKLKLLETETE